MVILTLYVRYFEEIPKKITEAENRLSTFMDTSMSKFQRIWLNHIETLQVTYSRLERTNDSLEKVEALLQEKPKSLRLQFETELKGLLGGMKTKCTEIMDGMADYWARVKSDQEGVTFHQHMTFFGVGVLVGVVVAVLVAIAIAHG
jgi:hypothetical protein